MTTVYLMDKETGAVDTKENWLAQMESWVINREGLNQQQQLDNLIEVVKNENGDWERAPK